MIKFPIKNTTKSELWREIIVSEAFLRFQQTKESTSDVLSAPDVRALLYSGTFGRFCCCSSWIGRIFSPFYIIPSKKMSDFDQMQNSTAVNHRGLPNDATASSSVPPPPAYPGHGGQALPSGPGLLRTKISLGGRKPTVILPFTLMKPDLPGKSCNFWVNFGCKSCPFQLRAL